jgi:hypothetical protein
MIPQQSKLTTFSARPPVFNTNNFSFMNSASSVHQPTLYECIANYFKPEHLTEMKCENCSSENEKANPSTKRKGFIKRQAIAKLPECLCLQIQRNSWSDSSYGMIKQTNHLKFPLSIKVDGSNGGSIKGQARVIKFNVIDLIFKDQTIFICSLLFYNYFFKFFSFSISFICG